jgi:hypothetical protein
MFVPFLFSSERERLIQKKSIGALKANHGQTALTMLCADETFPPGAVRHTVGGHAAGWNHVNIDFIKLADGWTIDEIWICR